MNLEAEYDNRARVPEHPAIFARWAQDAAAYRSGARSDLGIAYGPGARQIIDLFHGGPGAATRPVIVFIHGGYWRALDPRQFSHMAAGLNARGFDVAVTGYDLCPQITIPDIIDQQRAACGTLWRRLKRRMVVTGHSAGGHLAAAMLATDWTAIDHTLPRDLVFAAVAISGLFDLTPLLSVSMNADLRLTPETARDASPAFWPAPAGFALDAVVGGQESSEFIRQTHLIADVWGPQRVDVRAGAVPGTNHFTVLDPLTHPSSLMVSRIARLAGRRPA